MSRRLRDDEGDPNCDAPGSVSPMQQANIRAAFACVNKPQPEWGQFIYETLHYYRIGWRWGGRLEKLSCRQAGLVLHALHFTARGVLDSGEASRRQ